MFSRPPQQPEAENASNLHNTSPRVSCHVLCCATSNCRRSSSTSWRRAVSSADCERTISSSCLMYIVALCRTTARDDFSSLILGTRWRRWSNDSLMLSRRRRSTWMFVLCARVRAYTCAFCVEGGSVLCRQRTDCMSTGYVPSMLCVARLGSDMRLRRAGIFAVCGVVLVSFDWDDKGETLGERRKKWGTRCQLQCLVHNSHRSSFTFFCNVSSLLRPPFDPSLILLPDHKRKSLKFFFCSNRILLIWLCAFKEVELGRKHGHHGHLVQL